MCCEDVVLVHDAEYGVSLIPQTSLQGRPGTSSFAVASAASYGTRSAPSHLSRRSVDSPRRTHQHRKVAATPWRWIFRRRLLWFTRTKNDRGVQYSRLTCYFMYTLRAIRHYGFSTGMGAGTIAHAGFMPQTKVYPSARATENSIPRIENRLFLNLRREFAGIWKIAGSVTFRS